MRLLLLSFAFLLSYSSIAQEESQALLNAKIDVVFLSADMLEGRASGSEGEILAAKYISTRFYNLGLSNVDEGWYQMFPCGKSENPHSTDATNEKTCRNVMAMIDNKAENTIIIGAHYDHLGHGEIGSLDTDKTAIHNGADDNASGIAGLLYLAEKLQAKQYKANNYIFLAFSGEEMGLLGSSYYVSNPAQTLSTANYMINMDMIGRLNKDKGIIISGVGTSPVWKPAFKALERDFSFTLDEKGTGPSDHTSFYRKSIPVLHFFTGTHADYHKSTDDAHLVNYDGILDVANLIADLIEYLNNDDKLEFTATQEKESEKVSFKVSLGVIPDYVFDKGGMRVDGVLPNRPGANAGMKDGDIIVKLGDIKVNDVYDYMKGLNAHSPGQKSTIVVKRGEELIELEVEF